MKLEFPLDLFFKWSDYPYLQYANLSNAYHSWYLPLSSVRGVSSLTDVFTSQPRRRNGTLSLNVECQYLVGVVLQEKTFVLWDGGQQATSWFSVILGLPMGIDYRPASGASFNDTQLTLIGVSKVNWVVLGHVPKDREVSVRACAVLLRSLYVSFPVD